MTSAVGVAACGAMVLPASGASAQTADAPPAAGLRIGGQPGPADPALASYAQRVLDVVREAVVARPDLIRSDASVVLGIGVAETGALAFSIVTGSGDDARDARLLRHLEGLQVSEAPPRGLPPITLTLNTRSGA